MNIYDRIINILLEARVEDFLDRLDEANAFDAGHSEEVRGANRQRRFEDKTGISPARSEAARQAVHKTSRGNPRTRVMNRAYNRLTRDGTRMGEQEPLGPNRKADLRNRVKKGIENLRSSPKPQLP